VYRSRGQSQGGLLGDAPWLQGAFEMAATVDYLFAYDATTGCGRPYVPRSRGGVPVRLTCADVHSRKNPWALREDGAVVRSHQRGLWQDADQEMVDELRSLVHQAEAAIKMKVGSLSSYRTFSPLAQAFRGSSVAFSADNNFALLGIAFLGMTYPLSIRSLAKL